MLILRRWIAENNTRILRASLFIIYFWFGILKVFGFCPAEKLISETIFWVPASVCIPVLGIIEIGIAIGFLFRGLLKYIIPVMLFHLAGTMLPFFILPDVCFVKFPFVLTLEGQYIIKNIVLGATAIVIGINQTPLEIKEYQV